MSDGAASPRIAALDLVRGVAVLGILTINVASFAGGSSAALSPSLFGPASPADSLAFAANMVLFEGKMRGLFTVLFGASLLLFIDRRAARGDDGMRRQLHRLGWLFLIGYAHQLLLWSGDILMLYAMLAPAALALHRWPPQRLVMAALLLFTLWHGALTLAGWPTLMAADQAGSAARVAIITDAHNELVELRLPWLAMVAERFSETLYAPFLVALFTMGETIPLMLLGMGLYRSGFFAGDWPRRRLWQLALGGMALGLPLALGQAWWAWERDFPPEAMFALLLGPAGAPHLALTLAYAALLVLAAPALLATAPGQRLRAVGQMALSNYLLSSLLMAFFFHGWGLGLIGTVGTLGQWPYVLAVWLVLLGWSKPWLERYRQGPVEWLWRSLTERQWQAFKR